MNFVARPRPNCDWVTQAQWVIAALCVVKIQWRLSKRYAWVPRLALIEFSKLPTESCSLYGLCCIEGSK